MTTKTKTKDNKKKRQFSKTLLLQESILIWVTTVSLIALAFICILTGSIASVPWISGMIAFPWTAYGVSQGFYYNKSKKENTAGGVVYETALLECQNSESWYEEEDLSGLNLDGGI